MHNHVSHFHMNFMESPISSSQINLVQQWRQRRQTQNEGRCRLALPNGSLQRATLDALNRAGYDIADPGRSLSSTAANDPDLLINWYRSMEIPAIVAQGYADIGITGDDMVEEERLKLRVGATSSLEYIQQFLRALEDEGDTNVQELRFSRGELLRLVLLSRMDLARVLLPVANYDYAKNGDAAKWVLAVKEESPFMDLQDLVGGRVDAEIPYITARFLAAKGILPSVIPSIEYAQSGRPGFIVIVPSQGATEGKGDQLADGIVTVTEGGDTLKSNGLRILEKIRQTRVALFINVDARKRGWGRKAKEIAIQLLDAAGLHGELLEEFDRDSRALA